MRVDGIWIFLENRQKRKKKVFVQRTNFHGVGEGVEGEMVSYTGERLGMVYLSFCMYFTGVGRWEGRCQIYLLVTYQGLTSCHFLDPVRVWESWCLMVTREEAKEYHFVTTSLWFLFCNNINVLFFNFLLKLLKNFGLWWWISCHVHALSL